MKRPAIPRETGRLPSKHQLYRVKQGCRNVKILFDSNSRSLTLSDWSVFVNAVLGTPASPLDAFGQDSDPSDDGAPTGSIASDFKAREKALLEDGAPFSLADNGSTELSFCQRKDGI
jgi:hypothetical protein